jgi:hypothetical protein
MTPGANDGFELRFQRAQRGHELVCHLVLQAQPQTSCGISHLIMRLEICQSTFIVFGLANNSQPRPPPCPSIKTSHFLVSSHAIISPAFATGGWLSEKALGIECFALFTVLSRLLVLEHFNKRCSRISR